MEPFPSRDSESFGFEDTIPSDRNPLPGLINGYTGSQNPFPVPEEVVSNGRCAALTMPSPWSRRE